MNLINPLSFVTLFYCSGILLARFPFLRPAVPALLLIFIALILSGKYKVFYIKSALVTSSLLLFATGLGFVHTASLHTRLPANHIFYAVNGEKADLTGVLVKPPLMYGKGERLLLETVEIVIDGRAKQVTGRARISLYAMKSNAKYGDTVRIQQCRLRVPSNFNNPGGFDYRGYLRDRGVYVTGSISRKNRITVLRKKEGKNLYSLLYDLKHAMVSFLESSLPSREAGILRTMVFGDKKAITADERDLFSVAGVSHLLAVSGLHVGFVSLLFYYLWNFSFLCCFSRWSKKYFLLGYSMKFAAFATIFPVAGYTIIAGNSPASFRAAIMIGVYLTSIILGRERDILSSMILAALILLLKNPTMLFDVGFQFSFSAVFSILYGYPRVMSERRDEHSGSILRTGVIKKNLAVVARWMIISLLAMAGTLPLSVYYFNMVSLASPITNIAAVPLTGLIVPSTLMVSGLSLLSRSAASFLLIIPETLCGLLLFFIDLVNRIPFTYFRIGTPSLFTLLLYYVTLYGLFQVKKGGYWKTATTCASLCLLCSLLLPSLLRSYAHKGTLQAVFLDVGQGGGVFIRFPAGQTMLIDSGGVFGDFNIGRGVVAPFLWDQGITRLDYVIGTHPDRDHIGGLSYILKEFDVGRYIDNGDTKNEISIQAIRKIVAEKNISYQSVSAGDAIALDESTGIEFFNPTKDDDYNRSSSHDNYHSIVTKISYKGFSLLLTGDIDKKAERGMIKQGRHLQSTVMEVPHHGSRSSNSPLFIKSVSPEAVVISVGASNPFRHPSPRVVQRYREADIRVYRTDRDGAVTIESDGEEYSITAFVRSNQSD